MSVLQRLLKADAAFEWTVEHERALQAIQEELQSEKFLVIFDPSLPTQIATDASGTGLGAVLLQNGRPVSYAARSLTKAEQNYSIIEKELLAVVFALRRFHYYTLGRRIEILTDHQPLLGAAQNALLCDNPRLDRLFDQILAYDIKWTYVPGKTNYLPDFLSRLPANAIKPLPTDAIHTLEPPVACGRVFWTIFAASELDDMVQFVRESLPEGWPDWRTAYPPEMRFLCRFAHTLRVCEGVIVDTQDRVYVPQRARESVLCEMHVGHPGPKTCFEIKTISWCTMCSVNFRFCGPQHLPVRVL
jgi:hypothetical protein